MPVLHDIALRPGQWTKASECAMMYMVKLWYTARSHQEAGHAPRETRLKHSSILLAHMQPLLGANRYVDRRRGMTMQAPSRTVGVHIGASSLQSVYRFT